MMVQLAERFRIDKYRGWSFVGATLGLILPFAIRWYEVLSFSSVRPITRWLLWPTSILSNIDSSLVGPSAVILGLLTVLGNATLFGLVARFLRRAFLGFVLLVPILIWTFLPPSDATLTKRFAKHRAELEQLANMANGETQLVRIAPSFAKTIKGERVSFSGTQTVLSEQRIAEYRRLFKSAGLKDGLYKSAADGDVFLSIRRSSKVDPAGSSFGYLFCPALDERYGFVPCMENRDSGKKGAYRWKRLDSKWFLYEAVNRGIE
jgi:hypothetical protein